MLQWPVSAGGGRERERFPGRQESVSLPGLRSQATWENGAEHSGSQGFADTEEDGGSTPPAPTTSAMSRAFVSLLVPLRICWMS
jgi:hypothetical protein